MEATDLDLHRRLVEGDAEATSELYRRHIDGMRAVAERVTRDPDFAADAAHDAFVQFLDGAQRYDVRRGPVGAYLRMTARRRAIDLVRSVDAGRRREHRAALRAAEAAESAETITLRRADAVAVRRALASLGEEHHRVLTRAYGADLSYRQVADELGLPEGTAKSRIRSALATLRRDLAADVVPA